MNPETEVSDLLSILMPPTRLRIWLDKVFTAKAAKGETVPEEFTIWMGIVERICSDLPSEIDGITTEQWAWIERKIFANRPKALQLQPELLNMATVKELVY